jgi:hypothetical protein
MQEGKLVNDRDRGTPFTSEVTAAGMPTAAGLPESVGKSATATVGKLIRKAKNL